MFKGVSAGFRDVLGLFQEVSGPFLVDTGYFRGAPVISKRFHVTQVQLIGRTELPQQREGNKGFQLRSRVFKVFEGRSREF